MSTWSDTIVDIDVTAQEAPQLAEVIGAWLVGERIIEPEISDRAEGHPPGARYVIAIESDEDVLARQYGGFYCVRSVLDTRPNGLEILVGREMFLSYQNGLELRCDRCGYTFDLLEDSDSAASAFSGWEDAADAWQKGDDQASFACPGCGQRTLLTEWRGPRPWAFGNLALRFWNWSLSEKFIHTVASKLGHRAVLVRAHI
jgi:DNA-directed RNA polymerase subunit RPC12/RpoP